MRRNPVSPPQENQSRILALPRHLRRPGTHVGSHSWKAVLETRSSLLLENRKCYQDHQTLALPTRQTLSVGPVGPYQPPPWFDEGIRHLWPIVAGMEEGRARYGPRCERKHLGVP